MTIKPPNPSPAEYQAQDDAVNVGTTPMVGYSYADGAANTVRAVGLECPNGRQVEYNYGAAGGDGDRLSRVASVARRYGADWATPEYDRAGNMTVIPKPENPTTTFTGTYDAWNRLVHLSGINATYRYDAFNRRTTTLVDSTERHFYYTADWQCIEERLDSSSNPDRQYVWGLRYIDDLVLRDRDTNANGDLDERLYALQDANWNVTAIINAAGDVQERYSYTPYGVSVILGANFGELSTALCEFEFGYAGYRRDSTGLMDVRRRMYHPGIGAWVQRDPAEYGDGWNLYQYLGDNPNNKTDPTGLMCAVEKQDKDCGKAVQQAVACMLTNCLFTFLTVAPACTASAITGPFSALFCAGLIIGASFACGICGYEFEKIHEDCY